MAISPQELIDTEVRHATFVNRFSGGLSKDFWPFLDDLRVNISTRLSKEGVTIFSTARLRVLLKDIEGIQNAIYNDYQPDLFENLNSFSSHESNFEHGALSDAVPKFSFDLPSDSQVWSAVRTTPVILPNSKTAASMTSFVKNWTRAEKLSVARQIRFGFLTGQTISQITRAISGKNGSLDRVTRRNNKAIVRTSVNHTSTAARQKVFTENDDIVIGYTVISTLDNRTSSICKGWDHVQVRFADKDHPRPPFHPNCRTTTVALLNEKFQFDDGTVLRGSVGADGRTQTSAKTSYFQWLKNQGKVKNGRAFVFDTIGRKRGKLLLDGGLSSDEFKKLTTTQDGLFRPISLDELQKKDSLSKAFDRANIPPGG